MNRIRKRLQLVLSRGLRQFMMGSSNEVVYRPRRVVSLKGDKPEFHGEVIQDIIQSCSAESSLVFVICVTGVYRSGKSFLLNLMQMYLDYYVQHQTDHGWEKKHNKLIKGIHWAGGQNAVTEGIWMWAYSVPVNGTQLLFLDCQGTGDIERGAATLDNLITFLGLTMSNVQILNIEKRLDSSALERMNVCTMYAEEQAKFEKLIILVRDWPNEEPHSQLSETVETTKSDTVKEWGQAILKCFHDTQVCCLPDPGKVVKKASEKDNVSIGSVETDFILAVKTFCQKLLIELPRKSNTKLTGADFFCKFGVLGAMGVPKVKTQADAVKETFINNAFEKARQNFTDELGKILESNHDLAVDELETKVQKLFEQTKDMFLSDGRVQRHATDEKRREYVEMLQHMADEAVNAFKYETRMKELSRQNDECKKQLEAFKEKKRQLKKKQGEQKDNQRTSAKNEKSLEELEQEIQKLQETAEQALASRDQLLEKKAKEMENERNRLFAMAGFEAFMMLGRYIYRFVSAK